jgi:putative flippase GtrA
MAWPAASRRRLLRQTGQAHRPRAGPEGSDPLIATLRERFGRLVQELAKFGVVGAIGFVVNVGGYNGLRFDLHVGPVTSGTIAYLAAAVVTFLGNRYWTFRHRHSRGTMRDSVLFFVFNGVAYLIQTASIALVNYTFGLTDQLSNNIALLFGIALGTLFRFWSYSRWVWADRSSGGAGTAEGEPLAGRPEPAEARAVAVPPAYAETATPASRQAGSRR